MKNINKKFLAFAFAISFTPSLGMVAHHGYFNDPALTYHNFLNVYNPLLGNLNTKYQDFNTKKEELEEKKHELETKNKDLLSKRNSLDKLNKNLNDFDINEEKRKILEKIFNKKPEDYVNVETTITKKGKKNFNPKLKGHEVLKGKMLKELEEILLEKPKEQNNLSEEERKALENDKEYLKDDFMKIAPKNNLSKEEINQNILLTSSEIVQLETNIKLLHTEILALETIVNNLNKDFDNLKNDQQYKDLTEDKKKFDTLKSDFKNLKGDEKNNYFALSARINNLDPKYLYSQKIRNLSELLGDFVNHYQVSGKYPNNINVVIVDLMHMTSPHLNNNDVSYKGISETFVKKFNVKVLKFDFTQIKNGSNKDDGKVNAFLKIDDLEEYTGQNKFHIHFANMIHSVQGQYLTKNERFNIITDLFNEWNNFIANPVILNRLNAL